MENLNPSELEEKLTYFREITRGVPTNMMKDLYERLSKAKKKEMLPEPNHAYIELGSMILETIFFVHREQGQEVCLNFCIAFLNGVFSSCVCTGIDSHEVLDKLKEYYTRKRTKQMRELFEKYVNDHLAQQKK